MLSVLRRIEFVAPYLTGEVAEVCAEADASDAEMLLFVAAELGQRFGRVIREEDAVLHPMVCFYDRRRMHFCVVREG